MSPHCVLFFLSLSLALQPPFGGAPGRETAPLPGEQFAQILANEDVRKELGLASSDGFASLRRSLVDADGSLRQELASAPPGNKDARIQARQVEVQSKLAAAVGSDKSRRLRQLQLQAIGLGEAIRIDGEAKARLGLTPEVERKAMEAVARVRPDLSASDPSQLPKRMAEFRLRQEKAVEALLSPEQRKAWAELTGPRTAAVLMPPIPLGRAPGAAMQPSGGMPGFKGLPPILAGRQTVEMLKMPDVAADMKLTDVQKQALAPLFEKLQKEDEAFRAKHAEVGLEQTAALLVERQNSVDAEVSAALSPTVAERLHQLQRQAGGLLACMMSDPTTKEKLGIKPEQLQKIGGLFRSGKMPPLPPPSPDPVVMKKAFQDLRRKHEALLLNEVFTAEQRKIWEELIGKRVDFEIPVMPVLPPPPRP